MRRLIYVALCALTACTTVEVPSTQVWLTSEAGDKCAEQEAVVFTKSSLPFGNKSEEGFTVNLDDRRQTIDGFGNSITE